MSREHLILTLAKVLIAASWADRELTHDEINSMKDLLYGLPQITGRQWASLQIYIESPVGEAERARLIQELRQAIRTPAERALALRALDLMMHADGPPTEEEEAAATQIQAAMEAVDVGLLGRLVKGMTSRRSQAVAGAPNREDDLEEYIKNKVYYGVRRRLARGSDDLAATWTEGIGQLSDETLRKLSLAAGLMAQVARVHPQGIHAEREAMADALETHWQLSRAEAEFVVEVALSETASLLDRYRLARQFAAACGRRERAAMLDVLFAVAAADGRASYDEIEEIRAMARSLKLSHQDFIQAKLKLPREKRAQ